MRACRPRGIAQLLARNLSSRTLTTVGALLLALGMGVTAVALSASSADDALG
ncbi:MAG TPA: hypothetical protein VMD79_12700 [Solirubrobacteraceae bacterium]|nr:hypothetical protein [Solirubrobacteraceae bacterium]